MATTYTRTYVIYNYVFINTCTYRIYSDDICVFGVCEAAIPLWLERRDREVAGQIPSWQLLLFP